MEQPISHNLHEHVIHIARSGAASISVFYEHAQDDSGELHYEDRPSTSTQPPISQSSATSSTTSNSRNVSSGRRGDTNVRRRRSPLNSGLWISIELVVNLSQIIAAIIVLSLSRHEHPKAPLFTWAIGYTVGCLATLPHLYWRYIHRNPQALEQNVARQHQRLQNDNRESNSFTALSVTQALEGSDRNNTGVVSQFAQNLFISGPRLHALVEHLKMALDCFFAVWFVIGNVWIFGGHSSASDAPNLYRLCIVFLTFSCIGYAMPFVLCATICCCLPCIISVLGFREDLRETRGATTESIGALPTYKFKLKRKKKRGESESGSEGLGEGGIVAAGTDKERIISAEDAVCCICLAKYLDNDDLRELPCTHLFHTGCVDKWLKINALCPLCKSEVGDAMGLVSRSNSG